MNSPFKIKAVSLDAMGTLIHLNKTAAEVYYQVLIAHEISPQQIYSLLHDKSQYPKFWKMAEQKISATNQEKYLDRYSNSAKINFWHLLFATIFEYYNLPIEKLEQTKLATIEEFAKEKHWQLEKTAIQLFNFCQENQILLFVTSNFDERLPDILKNLKVAHYFKKIITSAEVGYEKPSHRIFEHLLQEAQCPAKQIIHVGDTWLADVEGAKQAKMIPIFFEKRFKNKNILSIKTLEQLIGIIQNYE